MLPWKTFVDTWLGRRVTMGYLGNVLAIAPDYSGFDAIVAHGDSLLLPMTGKPVDQDPLRKRARRGAFGALNRTRAAAARSVRAGAADGVAPEGVVAVSESTRRQNPFVRRVICLGVDDRLFAPEPRERSAQALAAVRRHAGRPQARGLPAALLRRRVRRAHPDATLTIVGDQGPPCAGVTYRIGVADIELASLYRRAWAYVTPSTYEGFGLPYLEAMACGTPVVATPNPGSVEILDHGKYGVLAGGRGVWRPHLVATFRRAVARRVERARAPPRRGNIR